MDNPLTHYSRLIITYEDYGEETISAIWYGNRLDVNEKNILENI